VSAATADGQGRLVLSDPHWKFLRDRAVADDVATERGYLSANRKFELLRLGFGQGQQLRPCTRHLDPFGSRRN
jgi:hypothetical protein